MGVRLCEHKVKFMLENEKEYDFPEFIRQIRKSLGRPRPLVSSDTGVSEWAIYRLEVGDFAIAPIDKVIALAEYYNVPRHILVRKCKNYLWNRSRKKIVEFSEKHEDCVTRPADQSSKASI